MVLFLSMVAAAPEIKVFQLELKIWTARKRSEIHPLPQNSIRHFVFVFAGEWLSSCQ